MRLPAPAPATRVALQVAAAAGLATALGHLLPIERPQWAVISAALVIGTTWGESLRRSWQRALGTVAGAVVGLAAVTLLHGLPVDEAVAAFTALFAMLYAGSSRPVALAGLGTVIVAMMLGILVDAGPHLLIVRIYETGLGVAIAVVVSGLLSLVRRRDAADAAVDGALEAMGAGVAAALARACGARPADAPAEPAAPWAGLARAEATRASFADLRYEGVLLGRTAGRVARLEILIQAMEHHAVALARDVRPIPAGLTPPLRDALATLAARLAAGFARARRSRGGSGVADDTARGPDDAAFAAAQTALRAAVLAGAAPDAADGPPPPLSLVELAYHAARLDTLLATLAAA